MSTVANRHESPDEVRELARAWYAQQVKRCEQCLGTLWPRHREWVEAYLAEEVRQKLIARGWRPKHGGA